MTPDDWRQMARDVPAAVLCLIAFGAWCALMVAWLS